MKPKKSIAWRTDFMAFDMGGEKEEELGFKFRETEYNENNAIARQLSFDKKGDVILELVNKYDSNSRLVETTETNIEDLLAEKTVFEYDDKGNILMEAQYFNDELFEKITYLYDANGNLTETTTLDTDELPIIKETRQYNDKNQCTLIMHSENDELQWEVKRTYNVANNVAEETTKEHATKRTEKTVNHYNGQGKKTKSETFDEQGNLLHENENEYDENGNATVQVSKDTFLNATHTVLTNVYDDKNRVTESEMYDARGDYLVSKEIVSFNEEGQINDHETYHHNINYGMQKTHFRLRYEWEYY